MTDQEIYMLLVSKSQNIKMHMEPGQVLEAALRFRTLSEFAREVVRVNPVNVVRCRECQHSRILTGADGDKLVCLNRDGINSFLDPEGFCSRGDMIYAE